MNQLLVNTLPVKFISIKIKDSFHFKFLYNLQLFKENCFV